ncbi:hypothetical protein HPB50_019034 [Hyalomma asiaticum]|uniref:Uncharacterized protein n=1 Tax=Hyalomma asiaticum TaxID=266040 RepID=A0ACB7TKW4_HYAAI|nr:hypothetical protein HPB50_019034 [Hyalomma asiaticum]
MQCPIVSTTCPQLEFLRKIPEWLDYWASLKHDAGHLTKETHLAFGHTSHALHEISVYCLEELKFRYVLLGQFQTDSLEDRFEKYRQLSGAQYHISIRQIYESENKLRLQKVLDLPDLDVISQPIPAISVASLHAQFSIAVTDADVAKKSSVIPAVTGSAVNISRPVLKLPRDKGGLGIPDLGIMATALHVRWTQVVRVFGFSKFDDCGPLARDMANYGKVLGVSDEYIPGWPEVLSGIRRVRIEMARILPILLRVDD